MTNSPAVTGQVTVLRNPVSRVLARCQLGEHRNHLLEPEQTTRALDAYRAQWSEEINALSLELRVVIEHFNYARARKARATLRTLLKRKSPHKKLLMASPHMRRLLRGARWTRRSTLAAAAIYAVVVTLEQKL